MGRIWYRQLMKDRIKRLMESQHMTQQTFADFIGLVVSLMDEQNQH